MPRFLLAGLFATAWAHAGFMPIRVDQFGYPPDATKIAVIADPQTGFDASESYTPGASLQVHRVSDDEVVFASAGTGWKSGATDDASGDRCWWFDFSSVTAPGIYYISDPATGVRSDVFEISSGVYRSAAIQAVRMFFYQRCAFAKEEPYVNARWIDGAAFMRGNQDPKCRLVSARNDASTERDLRGGWFDAGDFNKYTTFARDTLQDLLLPPSTDANPRYYGAASTRSTLTGADVFAHAAIVFATIGRPETDTFAGVLRAAAIQAWDWVEANPAVFFDNVGFSSAHPDGKQNGGYSDNDDIAVSRARAAAKLLVLTGEDRFRTFFNANYQKAHLFAWSFAYVFESGVQDGILYYLRAVTGTESVKSNIRNAYTNAMKSGSANLPAFTGAGDPYRAHLEINNYTWGSNSSKAKFGNMFRAMVHYGLDPANLDSYQAAAAGYLHYLHGTNPLTLVYLCNMEEFGAERSVTEFYHNWFTDGSVWDSVVTSPNGPPPGFLTGGPNLSFTADASYSGPRLAPPLDQPAMKSYRDWNTSWPENSWSISEPAIYYQAAYVRLVAAFLDDRQTDETAMVNLSARTGIGVGAEAVIPGFAITGTTSAKVLVRAVGPTLADFGVSDTATDPVLTLYDNATLPATVLATNADWGAFADQTELAAIMNTVGAFPPESGQQGRRDGGGAGTRSL